MVSFPRIQELSSDSSSSLSSSLSPISLEAKVQLETSLKALFGTPYMGGAHYPTPFVVVYLEAGELGDTATHFD